MKKLILLSVVLFSLVLIGCEADSSTYQVFNNCPSSSTTLDPYLNGSLYEVVVFCYAGADVVREDSYIKISVGEKTEVKEVPEYVTKIKISYKVLPPASKFYNLSDNNRSYVVAYTLIEPGKNVIAEVNGHSMVSK